MSDSKAGPSRVMRNKKGKLIEANQKQTIYNVVVRNLEMGNSKTKSVNLAASATGFSERSIWALIAEKKCNNEFSSPNRKKLRKDMYEKLDEDQLKTVHKHVKDMLLCDKPLTLRKLMTVIKQDNTIPNMSTDTLRKLMRKLGFKFSKTDNDYTRSGWSTQKHLKPTAIPSQSLPQRKSGKQRTPNRQQFASPLTRHTDTALEEDICRPIKKELYDEAVEDTLKMHNVNFCVKEEEIFVKTEVVESDSNLSEICIKTEIIENDIKPSVD